MQWNVIINNFHVQLQHKLGFLAKLTSLPFHNNENLHDYHYSIQQNVSKHL